MLKNLTIGKKLAMGFTAVLILTGLLGTISVLQMKKIDSEVMDLVDIHIPLSSLVSDVDAAATNQNLEVSLYAIHREEEQLEKFASADQEVDQLFAQLLELINSDAELVAEGWAAKVEQIAASHDVFVTSCREFIDVVKARNNSGRSIPEAADAVETAYEPFMAAVDKFLSTNTEETTRIGINATTTADAAITWTIIIGIATVIVGAGLAYVIARGINKALRTIIAGLAEGSEQVAAASGQVSSASQSLAEGATEQAAGLEETSSSLEEMASMTKQNADNAQQANALAGEARKAADSGAESMRRMNGAIQEIQRSSDETAKIIKVIDDIAFQTNLLALNAAVEAARAGEAGKGFAVVAEEVRNLAMRSAEAAKNTSNMIEESVKNSKNGVDIASEVGKILEEIVQSVGKTTDLVSEIAAASQEQAQGIDQVNTAVAQMDKVTQQNAANAEESASASEELSAQAISMNDIVGQLVALVGGSATRAKGSAAQSNGQGPSGHSFGKSDETWHRIAKGTNRRARTQAAANAIPLDDGDGSFDDFNA